MGLEPMGLTKNHTKRVKTSLRAEAGVLPPSSLTRPLWVILVLVFVCFFCPHSLQADEKKLQEKAVLEWKSVPGAGVYRIQVRKKGGPMVLEEKTGDTRIEVDLPPGNYEQRVGALNKFSKVSAWSSWKALDVVETARPALKTIQPRLNEEKEEFTIEIKAHNILQSTRFKLNRDGESVPVKEVRKKDTGSVELVLDIANLKSGNYSIELENPGGLKDTGEGLEEFKLDQDNLAYWKNPGTELRNWGKDQEPEAEKDQKKPGQDGPVVEQQKDGIEKWELLIPGYYQWRTQRPIQAGSWGLWFSGLAGGGYAGYSMANGAVNSLKGDFLFNMFSSTYNYQLYYSMLPASVDPSLLYLVHFNNVQSAQQTYSTGQTIQGVAGGLALASYFGYLTYETWENLDWKTPIPGYKRLEKGDTITGITLASLAALSAGVTAEGFSSSNSHSKKAKSTLFYKLYNDPATWYLTQTTMSSSAITNFSLLDFATYSSEKAAYSSAQSRYAVGSGVLAAVLLYNYIDSSLFVPDHLPGKKDRDLADHSAVHTTIAVRPYATVDHMGEGFRGGAVLQIRF